MALQESILVLYDSHLAKFMYYQMLWYQYVAHFANIFKVDFYLATFEDADPDVPINQNSANKFLVSESQQPWCISIANEENDVK